MVSRYTQVQNVEIQKDFNRTLVWIIVQIVSKNNRAINHSLEQIKTLISYALNHSYIKK